MKKLSQSLALGKFFLLLILSNFYGGGLRAQDQCRVLGLDSLKDARIEIHFHPQKAEISEFKVFVGNWKSEPELPGLSGKISREASGKLIFKPSFSFRPGLTYSVFYHKNSQIAPVLHFEIPENTSVENLIQAVYPRLDSLPENILKFYLFFSQPMQTGLAYQWVEILDQEGKALKEPFLKLQPELWDGEQKRLTLWLDPGRIKRALGPNELAGTPLEAGQQYTLKVHSGWPSQSGLKSQDSLSYSFQVSKADRVKVSPQKWYVGLPKSAEDSLNLDFGECLDWALLENCVHILDANGQVLLGTLKTQRGGEGLSFRPEKPWKKGLYQIRIQAKLEDLAGNNLNRVFDRDIQKESAGKQEAYFLDFEIKHL